jgi:CRP-like cAMP-binding protein
VWLLGHTDPSPRTCFVAPKDAQVTRGVARRSGHHRRGGTGVPVADHHPSPRGADGGLALLSILGRGDLIGELAALDGQPRSATVTAASTVGTRALTRANFEEFPLNHPDAAAAVSRSVGAKPRWATQRRIDFSGRTVKVRVARVLLELAALVGAAEPTVHKALTDLRRRQLVAPGVNP